MTGTQARFFVIAGMPRAATTFLYQTLPAHSGVFVPARKETDFFAVNHYRGADWYLDFFAGMSAEETGFDISPMYFMDPDAPHRIAAFNPDARIALVIREPIGWILSLHRQMQGMHYREIAFKDFAVGYTYKKDGRSLELRFAPGYIADTIRRYREVFGGRLLLCDFAAIGRDPLPTLRAIEQFAGLAPHFEAHNFNNVKVNSSLKKSPKLVNILMQQRLFADLVIGVVPKRLILAIRQWVQAPKTQPVEQSPATREDTEARALASEMFARDSEYVSALFRESSIVTGTGEVFGR